MSKGQNSHIAWSKPLMVFHEIHSWKTMILEEKSNNYSKRTYTVLHISSKFPNFALHSYNG